MSNHSNYYVENKMPLFFLVVAFVGCALSMSFSFTLKKYDSLSFLRVIGYNSVHIYCMQIIVMSVGRIMLVRFLHISNPTFLIISVLALGIFIPIVFYQLCLRLNAWVLFTLKRPAEELASIRTIT